MTKSEDKNKEQQPTRLTEILYLIIAITIFIVCLSLITLLFYYVSFEFVFKDNC